MKKSGFILLMLSLFWGCETDEPVSPTPLVDTVLEDTTKNFEVDTLFNYRTDTAELRSLLLGTWVKFEGSGVGDGIPYFVTPEYTHTFRQDGLVDIRDIESDSLICQEQYKLWFKVNRAYEVPYRFLNVSNVAVLSGVREAEATRKLDTLPSEIAVMELDEMWYYCQKKKNLALVGNLSC